MEAVREQFAVVVCLSCLAFTSAAAAQNHTIGAYPPGAGPDAPIIGAYPPPLGTMPGGPPPQPLQTPLQHDEQQDYCRSQPGICNVKPPDNADIKQHQLDETGKQIRDNQNIQRGAGPPK
jgi:hypothetical protein